jgi:hypothetical protein
VRARAKGRRSSSAERAVVTSTDAKEAVDRTLSIFDQRFEFDAVFVFVKGIRMRGFIGGGTFAVAASKDDKRVVELCHAAAGEAAGILNRLSSIWERKRKSKRRP